MAQSKFADYIVFLKDTVQTIEQYRTLTGRFDPNIKRLHQDLFHPDPFIVLGASLRATELVNDQSLYH